MIFFYWLLVILCAYSLLVFFISRFAVPFMEFGGFTPARRVPEEIKVAIADLEVRATDQRSYLEAAYELVMEKNKNQWHHTRFQAAFKFHRAFVKDLSEIWETKDFIYCTAINYLMAAFLVHSKYFKPGDIRVRHVFVNMFIHQYLQVNVNAKWVDVDPAGTGIRGKPLGTHLAGFG